MFTTAGFGLKALAHTLRLQIHNTKLQSTLSEYSYATEWQRSTHALLVNILSIQLLLVKKTAYDYLAVFGDCTKSSQIHLNIYLYTTLSFPPTTKAHASIRWIPDRFQSLEKKLVQKKNQRREAINELWYRKRVLVAKRNIDSRVIFILWVDLMLYRFNSELFSIQILGKIYTTLYHIFNSEKRIRGWST